MAYKKIFKISYNRVKDFRKKIILKVKSKRNNACHVTYRVPLTEAFPLPSFTKTQGMLEFSFDILQRPRKSSAVSRDRERADGLTHICKHCNIYIKLTLQWCNLSEVTVTQH